MPNPLATPDLYDYIVLAGKKSPGLCDVSGASTPRDWDVRKGYGLSGATVVYTGDGLAKFTVRLLLWEEAQFDAWDVWRALVKKTPAGTKPKAQDISHPFLAELGITSAVVEDELQWVQVEPGLFAKDIKFLQFRGKPAASLGKPTGSAAKPDQPTAQSAADKQIEALTAQLKGLSK